MHLGQTLPPIHFGEETKGQDKICGFGPQQEGQFLEVNAPKIMRQQWNSKS